MVIEYKNKSPDTKKILKLLGAETPRSSSHYVNKKIDSFARTSDRLIKPRLTYRVASFTTAGTCLVFENGSTVSSARLSRIMRGCTEAVCFAATVGRGVEERIRHCNRRGKYAEASILDAIGSVAAEETAEQFFTDMRRMAARRNQAVTIRFSPGYCDWPVTDQKDLLGLLDIESVGMSLTESCLMQPRKSVSGIFGIMKPGSLDTNPALYIPCTDCGKKGCSARRAAYRRTTAENAPC